MRKIGFWEALFAIAHIIVFISIYVFLNKFGFIPKKHFSDIFLVVIGMLMWLMAFLIMWALYKLIGKDKFIWKK